MPTWYTSWLPSRLSLRLDGISSAIQGHFLSFVLNKSFGHLLKPGQFDALNIKSQIERGHIQVNDLELNSEAINGYLTGLPVTFDTGTIASVTAHLSSSNPLTTQIGLLVKSLHLTFYVNPKAPSEPRGINLADSVTAMAESFIQEELSPREGAALWQSVHEEMMSSKETFIPGSLDPFQGSSNNELTQPEDDREPVGVSIFATLIERLLARFEFGMEDVKITLIHKDNMSISASFSELRYRTDDKDKDVALEGESRTLTLSGLMVTGQDLRPPAVSSPTLTLSSHTPSGSSRTPQSTRTTSPASSSSSLDDETQLAMSQSLAFLPPRPFSPASSVTSSMYQSAMSTTSTQRDDDVVGAPPGSPFTAPDLSGTTPQSMSRLTEVTLISFGATPITLQVKTPPPLAASEATSPVTLKFPDGLHFTLEMGVVACAAYSWTVRGLTGIADCWRSHSGSSSPTASMDSGSQSAMVALNLVSHIRGIVFILITPVLDDIAQNNSMRKALDDYFLHPLIPPNLGREYIRIHLEELSTTLSTSVSNNDNLHANPLDVKEEKPTRGGKVLLDSAISDMSVFLFRLSGAATDMAASPIIISDPNLPYQYNPLHLHPRQGASGDCLTLPMFEVKDWTQYPAFGPRLSYWRTRRPKQTAPKISKYNALGLQSTSPPSTMDTEAEVIHPLHTLRIKMEVDLSQGVSPNTNIEISVVPLHVFMDLSLLHENNSIMLFIRDATKGTSDFSVRHADEWRNRETTFGNDEDVTPPASPGVRGDSRSDAERVRREKLSLEELDFRYDYNIPTGSPEKRKHPKESTTNFSIDISLSMIRLEMRCPSSLGRSVRSGALVVDLHKLSATTRPPRLPKRSARLMTSPSPILRGSFIASIESKRIAVACSSGQHDRASVILSMGSLVEDSNDQSLSNALSPRITVTQSDTTDSSDCSVELPSIHVDISKPVADDLQYWADDVSQFLEHRAGVAERGNTRESSLIGSKYFATSRTGSGAGSLTPSSNNKGGMMLKIMVLEAFCRVHLPRFDLADDGARPFDISMSDMDVLLELEAQGKSIITMDIMNLTVRDHVPTGTTRTYLSLTFPRSMTVVPNPMLKLRFTTSVNPRTAGKESYVKLTLDGFTCDIYPDLTWVSELSTFVKSPPGTFETVIPSERTYVGLNISDGSVRLYGPTHPGGMVICVTGLEFSTDIIGDSAESSFTAHVPVISVLATDDMANVSRVEALGTKQGAAAWKRAGYALLVEAENLVITCSIIPAMSTSVDIEQILLQVHLCADTASAVAPFIEDVASIFQPPSDQHDIIDKSKEPTVLSMQAGQRSTIFSSVDDVAFLAQQPEIGSADMINDDLPTNLDYLDESFGAAGGLRELTDEDFEDFDDHQTASERPGDETIKLLQPEGIHIIEDYLDNIPTENNMRSGEAVLTVHVEHADFKLLLYGGYDWVKTRKTIEEGVKEMRKRLAKIRQLVASGQGQQPVSEETSALLFNSVYIGLEQDVDGLEPGAFIAAIDEELKDDTEVGSQSSWQSLRPPDTGKSQARPLRDHRKRLTRSKGPYMVFQLTETNATFEKYNAMDSLASRIFVTIKDVDILDHIKTSSWKKFLTSLPIDSRGNKRESGSNMVRIELCNVRPSPGHPNEEARLQAKILPLRLYVDQDALDFLKNFFSFKDPNATPSEDASPGKGEAYIQLADIFPVDLKLDYKPRRVDYRALRAGKTIELMNFFHFDGAEMTLRHITLTGITGWARLFDMLNDLWTPDVKATQLAEVISGVAPIRSIVNVGSGVADLVLLPIAQYKKDGRILRGVQKGASAFVKSTAIEAIKMGARLATGTQVILEQAESVLGQQFKDPVTAEPVYVPTIDEFGEPDFDAEDSGQPSAERYSKYADQPLDVQEGFQSAFRSVKTNINSAAQTILAVPMEVYERSGSEGPIRSVIRAVPIAVLKPMIGASEAISKTLLGLHNSLDPNLRHENEAKYKQRR